MFKVKFVLRTDTKDYVDTNLVDWKSKITEAVDGFNSKDSRITDKAVMELVEVQEKYFLVTVDIDQRFYPSERSFYTRVGAVSRSLKELGMHKILSPHGKLFSLSVEGEEEVQQSDASLRDEQINAKTIYLDYKNKLIMIPREMVDEYLIRFY